VVEADLILHVRDISHEDAQAQSQDVMEILDQLGIEIEDGAKLIEVWNKIDRLGEEDRARLGNLAERAPAGRPPVMVSALTGQGLDRLAAEIEARIAARRVVLDLDLDSADGAGISWLYRHAEVLAKDFREDGRLAVTVRVDPANAGVVRAKFGAGRPPLN
jgi:GTPase